MTAAFRCGAVVPSFNHWRALGGVVGRLRGLGMDVQIVDDGSEPQAAAAMAALHDPANGVRVIRLPVNRGKGVAVAEGLRLAWAAGCSHALQIDADGQHDLDAVSRLLAEARAQPGAVVTGAPVYDESAPAGRRLGRWITHACVFAETLSFRIRDSMCGLRIYPLAETLAVLAEERVGERMDFDTEIIVRLFWRGIPPVMVPVHVTYPPGNTSSFDLVRDNVRISAMHARLLAELALRWPRILRRRPPPVLLAPDPGGRDATTRGDG